MEEKDVHTTGTIRENRTGGANKKLIGSKELKKKERGNFNYCIDGKGFVAKWHDNAVVTIESNWETHGPLHTVNCRIKGGKKEVTQSHLINLYNKGMGGVHLMDRSLDSYCPVICGKKWYWPLFINVLNVSVVAAWRIHYQLEKNKLSYLKIRRHIALYLLKAEQANKRMSESSAGLPAKAQFEGLNHLLGSTTQVRCKVCKKNTKNVCVKCEVRLHAKRGKLCFKNYYYPNAFCK